MNDLLNIENKILVIRSQQVMLDRDLAELYEVETKRLNEAVRSNPKRFPAKNCFVLSDEETSTVLSSDIAIEISLQIIDAFIAMRHFLSTNAKISQRLDSLEQYKYESSQKIDTLFSLMDKYKIEDKQGIFFQGQI